MSDLNAALSEAMAKGGRPFRCFSCHGWFVDTNKAGGAARPRIICGARPCINARARYVVYGTPPGEPKPPTVDTIARDLITRAVVRALEADWLTDKEIAQEFGCSAKFVASTRARIAAKKRTRIRSRSAA
jgi:hypothetical protein